MGYIWPYYRPTIRNDKGFEDEKAVMSSWNYFFIFMIIYLLFSWKIQWFDLLLILNSILRSNYS